MGEIDLLRGEMKQKDAKLLKLTKQCDLLRGEMRKKDAALLESRKKLDCFRCETTFLRNQSLSELDKIELELKTALERVSKERIRLVEAERTLCVICTENQQSVVLMPCRHLCLCRECSKSPGVDKCPICRKPIEN